MDALGQAAYGSPIAVELALLRRRWPGLLAGLSFQYVHGIFTQLAYRNHVPLAEGPLPDLGFELLPELPSSARWASEALFTAALLTFLAWSLSPLMLPGRRFSAVLLWTRLLAVLVACQALRIVSFSATRLPGPAPHCRAGAATATRPPPHAWWGHVVVDVSTQVASSCGDLIFSSHMTFILTGALAYTHLGSSACAKVAVWVVTAALGLLIIAARKHYSVDVVVACYTVPLVYCVLHGWWAALAERQAGGVQQCAAAAAASASGEEGCVRAFCGTCAVAADHACTAATRSGGIIHVAASSAAAVGAGRHKRSDSAFSGSSCGCSGGCSGGSLPHAPGKAANTAAQLLLFGPPPQPMTGGAGTPGSSPGTPPWWQRSLMPPGAAAAAWQRVPASPTSRPAVLTTAPKPWRRRSIDLEMGAAEEEGGSATASSAAAESASLLGGRRLHGWVELLQPPPPTTTTPAPPAAAAAGTATAAAAAAAAAAGVGRWAAAAAPQSGARDTQCREL